MAYPVEEAVGERKKRIAAFQLGKIARGQAHHGDRVWRRPVAVHVGISGGIVATPQHSGKETFIVDGDGSPQARARFAEQVSTFRADHFQCAVAHVFQHPEYSFPRKTHAHVRFVTS